MRRALLLLLWCGCAPPESSAPADPALAALEHATGHAWRVRYQPDLHTAAWLSGRTPPLADSPAAAGRAARAFVLAQRDLFGLGDRDELQIEASELDELGMIHVHLAQQHAQLPVADAELRAHFAAEGALVQINGRTVPIGDLDAVPARSADQASAAALDDAATARPEVATTGRSVRSTLLTWATGEGGEAHLAWRVEVDLADPQRPARLVTFVDAQDGHVLRRTDALAWLEGSGTGALGAARRFTVVERDGAYWLEDPARGDQRTYSAGGRARLPGTQVHSHDLGRWDAAAPGAGAAVDAHALAAATWDHFSSRFGRAGWDGQGDGVRVVVHYGNGLRGAFFDGRQLVFGDGDAASAPAAAAWDVVAHEFAHGLIAATAALALDGESGALHEGIADAFACFVTADADGAGAWTVGEALGAPLRDLGDPARLGHPASVDEWVDTDDDGGGIHRNATIAGHAAYLVAQAIGVDEAERIWYRAVRHHLTARARLADAADATLVAAAELGGGVPAVRAAWIAAGVLRE